MAVRLFERRSNDRRYRDRRGGERRVATDGVRAPPERRQVEDRRGGERRIAEDRRGTLWV